MRSPQLPNYHTGPIRNGGLRRKDISNKAVIEKHKELGTIKATAEFFKCSTQLIHDVLYGLRGVEKKRKKSNLCTCCGINKRARGFRKLCLDCWHEHSEAGKVRP